METYFPNPHNVLIQPCPTEPQDAPVSIDITFLFWSLIRSSV